MARSSLSSNRRRSARKRRRQTRTLPHGVSSSRKPTLGRRKPSGCVHCAWQRKPAIPHPLRRSGQKNRLRVFDGLGTRTPSRYQALCHSDPAELRMDDLRCFHRDGGQAVELVFGRSAPRQGTRILRDPQCNGSASPQLRPLMARRPRSCPIGTKKSSADPTG